MVILTAEQIRRKIKRLAIQIVENNLNESELIFIGINNNGTKVASLLKEEILGRFNIDIKLTTVRLSPANPLKMGVALELPIEQFHGKTVILIDDVANTGRTMFYAMRPLMGILLKKFETAVLVDRLHKSFPVHVEYVGLSLATTLKQNILVEIEELEQAVAYLE